MKPTDWPVYRRLIFVGAGVCALSIGNGMSGTPYSQAVVIFGGLTMILAGIFNGPLA